MQDVDFVKSRLENITKDGGSGMDTYRLRMNVKEKGEKEWRKEGRKYPTKLHIAMHTKTRRDKTRTGYDAFCISLLFLMIKSEPEPRLYFSFGLQEKRLRQNQYI